MAEKNRTVDKMAKVCGMNRNTFSRKLRTGENFTLGEIFAICGDLDMDRELAANVFLAEDEDDVERFIL
jgi:DNA-binding phage protein